MITKTTTYTDFSRNGIISSRMRIINKLLLHDVLTRKDLSEQLGVSIATATNHTQDLIVNKVLLSETIPGVNSKRPLQKLSLNGELGMCSTIYVRTEKITAEIVFKMINNKKENVPQQVIVEPELVIRESTCNKKLTLKKGDHKTQQKPIDAKDSYRSNLTSSWSVPV